MRAHGHVFKYGDNEDAGEKGGQIRNESSTW